MTKYKVSERDFLDYICSLCDIHATEKNNYTMSFVDSSCVEFGYIDYSNIAKEWYIFK